MGKKSNSRKKKYWIGIDLGATKLLSAVLDKDFELVVSRKSKVEVSRGGGHFFKLLTSDVAAILRESGISLKEVQAMGIGCPGIVKFPQGLVKVSPNIPFLKNYPLGPKLKKFFGLPVCVENDVNAGLYGEFMFGAARASRHVAGIFLGTGIGGALILDGRIYRGATGAAGEIGHTFVELPFRAGRFPGDATFEGIAGRLRIASEAGYLMLKQKARGLEKITGTDVRKIKSKALVRALRNGDAEVYELLRRKAEILGIVMANLVNLLSPEKIILGGGLMEAAGDVILPAARSVMREYAMKPLVKEVKVLAAELEDYAVVMGAARLAADPPMAGKASA